MVLFSLCTTITFLVIVSFTDSTSCKLLLFLWIFSKVLSNKLIFTVNWWLQHSFVPNFLPLVWEVFSILELKGIYKIILQRSFDSSSEEILDLNFSSKITKVFSTILLFGSSSPPVWSGSLLSWVWTWNLLWFRTHSSSSLEVVSF